MNMIEVHYICMKIAQWNPLKIFERTGETFKKTIYTHGVLGFSGIPEHLLPPDTSSTFPHPEVSFTWCQCKSQDGHLSEGLEWPGRFLRPVACQAKVKV
jgi:hypothetical protein